VSPERSLNEDLDACLFCAELGAELCGPCAQAVYLASEPEPKRFTGPEAHLRVVRDQGAGQQSR
jgi:hypothetical protein